MKQSINSVGSANKSKWQQQTTNNKLTNIKYKIQERQSGEQWACVEYGIRIGYASRFSIENWKILNSHS